jgi:hypothetical protein
MEPEVEYLLCCCQNDASFVTKDNGLWGAITVERRARQGCYR